MPELPGDPKQCYECKKPIPDGWEYRMGPRMWHTHRWTCGHVTLTCRECNEDHKQCPYCGCQEEYT